MLKHDVSNQFTSDGLITNLVIGVFLFASSEAQGLEIVQKYH
jgi:hypothetical protein